MNDMATGTLRKNIFKGTSGIWTYFKFDNGVAMCWGNIIASLTLQTIGTYYHRATLRNIAYPSGLFVAAPIVFCTNQTSTFWIAVESNSTTQISNIHVYDVVNSTSNVNIGTFVIGRWK